MHDETASRGRPTYLNYGAAITFGGEEEIGAGAEAHDDASCAAVLRRYPGQRDGCPVFRKLVASYSSPRVQGSQSESCKRLVVFPFQEACITGHGKWLLIILCLPRLSLSRARMPVMVAMAMPVSKFKVVLKSLVGAFPSVPIPFP